MKTDARVRYTLRVLKESLLQLLEQKPINRITVKEVCEKAELNRATFYLHFSDCFDLLESIKNDLLRDFRKSLGESGTSDIESLISAIYGMIDRNENVCRVLIFENPNTALLRKMIESVKEASIANWQKELKNASQNDLEMLYIHLSNGLMHVVAEGYGKFDRKKVADFAAKVVGSTVGAMRSEQERIEIGSKAAKCRAKEYGRRKNRV